MGHFSMEISCAAGSLLSGNQQTNPIERLNGEIKRRTEVVAILNRMLACGRPKSVRCRALTGVAK